MSVWTISKKNHFCPVKSDAVNTRVRWKNVSDRLSGRNLVIEKQPKTSVTSPESSVICPECPVNYPVKVVAKTTGVISPVIGMSISRTAYSFLIMS